VTPNAFARALARAVFDALRIRPTAAVRGRTVAAVKAVIADASGTSANWAAIAAPALRARWQAKEAARLERASAILVRLLRGDDRNAIAADFGIGRVRLAEILRQYGGTCRRLDWHRRRVRAQGRQWARRARALVRAVERGAGEPAREFRQQALLEIRIGGARRAVWRRGRAPRA
jgi:hypothetical protein